MGHLGPRMSHLASQLQILCNKCFTFLYNERGQERHGKYIDGFSERNLVHSNLVILEQKWYGVLLALNLLSVFLLILHNKRDQRFMKTLLLVFEKSLIWVNLIFSGHFLMFDWVWSKQNQVTITIGSLKSQDMIKILKQSGHYFLVNVYLVDTVLRSYVMFVYGGDYSTQGHMVL